LDGTVLSVALPTLSRTLHASESDLQWFTAIYLLVLAASMLPAGLLGDRYGQKKVLLISLGFFGVGSAASGYSRTVADFMAARVLMGMAGAGVIVMAIAAVTVLFNKEERPKAVGVWTAANFLSLPIGPILGGWLLTNYWWGWVFLINVPVAVIGVVVGATLIPESRLGQRPRVDFRGVVTSALGLVALLYGLIKAGQDGWTNVLALLFIGAGLLVLVGFFYLERQLSRKPGGEPLLDLTLFESKSFTWGVILAAFVVLAMFGVLFTMPQYFQGVLGTNPIGSGLRLLSMIGGLVLGSLPSSLAVKRVGAKVTTAAGFLLIAGGLLVGSMTSVSSSQVFILSWMAVFGLGTGIAAASSSSAAMVELTEGTSGVGSAVLQAVNKTGAPLGTAILGSVLSAGYLAHLNLAGLPASAVNLVRQSVFGGVDVAHQLHSRVLLISVRTAFVNGMDRALLVSAGIALLGALLTVLYLPKTNSSLEVSHTGEREEGSTIGTE
jgi:EmrB/QacA subfamily drug resistance transporter